MEEIKAYFKTKYQHLSEIDITMLENQAKEILIHLLFKSQFRVDETKKQFAFEEYKFWIMRCMQEMVERLGITSAISYKENGISITFSREQLSEALRDEIVPIVSVRSR